MKAEPDSDAAPPLFQRIRWTNRFRALVASHERELAALAEREIAKPRWETLTAEIAPLLGSLRWHTRHAARLLRPRRLRAGGLLAIGQRHETRREPVGHVAIIATWNYPISLLGVQLTQAVIAGNAVTVKPSERAPETQALLLELARRAGLEGDRLRVAEATREAGRTLLAGHAFDHVVFTGSTEVGRAIAEVLAPTLTPSTLELSGRDSAFVLEDADPKLAARSIWFAATTNAGQTCMAPRRALVHARVYDAFLRELALLAGAASPRRLIDEAAARRCVDLAAAARRAGARSLTGVMEQNDGAALRPIVMTDCPADADLVEGRHFGPALAVVRCGSEQDMLGVHARCDQHLATSVFSRSPRAASERLAAALGAATVTFNDCLIPTAHPAASIGGTRRSGWGRSQGEAGLLALTREVTVSVTSRVVRAPHDTPAPARVARMARWITGMHRGDYDFAGEETTAPDHQGGPNQAGPEQAGPNEPAASPAENGRSPHGAPATTP